MNRSIERFIWITFMAALGWGGAKSCRANSGERQLFFSGILKSPQLSTPKELEDPLTGPSGFPTT
jgi:hypothetical protein